MRTADIKSITYNVKFVLCVFNWVHLKSVPWQLGTWHTEPPDGTPALTADSDDTAPVVFTWRGRCEIPPPQPNLLQVNAFNITDKEDWINPGSVAVMANRRGLNNSKLTLWNPSWSLFETLWMTCDDWSKYRKFVKITSSALYMIHLYQNQSIGRELTAPDTNCITIYSKVTLSLKKSDMIKSDRFWHRINKFKTVVGLRRALNCSKAFNLWQGWGLRICNSKFAQLLHCIPTA